MKSKHTKVDISSSKQKIDPILDKQSKLLKRALSYVKNYEHAKDFVQDTLLAVWLTKTKIKNGCSFCLHPFFAFLITQARPLHSNNGIREIKCCCVV